MIGDDPTLPEITALQPLDPRLAAGPLPDLPGPARRRQSGGWLILAGLLFVAPVLGGAYIGEPLSRAINGQPGDLGDVVEGFDGPGPFVTTSTAPAALIPPTSAGPPPTAAPTTTQPPPVTTTSTAPRPTSSAPPPPSTTTSTTAPPPPPDTTAPSTTSTSSTVPETTTTSTPDDPPDPSIPLP